MIILFIVFNLWYWIAEGATEGFTWATRSRRMNNKLIKPGKHDDPEYKKARGAFCYHTWRSMGENVGIFCIGITATQIKLPILEFILLFAAATLIGIFIYERVFNYIGYHKSFPKKKPWDVFNGKLLIPRSPWQDWAMLAIGIAILILRWVL